MRRLFALAALLASCSNRATLPQEALSPPASHREPSAPPSAPSEANSELQQCRADLLQALNIARPALLELKRYKSRACECSTAP